MENRNFMQEVEQINAANTEQPGAQLSATTFLTNEFHYKCKPDNYGNVAQILEFDSPFPSDMRNLPAPQNPQFADQFGKGEPSPQIVKNSGEKNSSTKQKSGSKFRETDDSCR